ncbi:cytochrome c6, chloroplastic [Impatiens glandulifera]|uniref:cytochrome c6, chloroplastic n=1 Tax=Impatiens glandulifera TaxID=253017 RepID=UPI001FB06185|nr:cytochrome c6, chloroplastic [Impatiens glandulifera]
MLPICQCWKDSLPLPIKELEKNSSAIRRYIGHEKKSKQVVNMKLAPALLSAFVLLSPPIFFSPPAPATEIVPRQTIEIEKRAATLFRKACVGCHDGGGNIIQPGATLGLKDLERNGVDSIEEIYNITYYGKGRMPGYGEKCTPRGQCTFGARLQEDDIKLLAEFVKSQANHGWENLEIYND